MRNSPFALICMYLYLHSRVLILSYPTEMFNNLSLGPPDSRDSYRKWSPSDRSTHKFSSPNLQIHLDLLLLPHPSQLQGGSNLLLGFHQDVSKSKLSHSESLLLLIFQKPEILLIFSLSPMSSSSVHGYHGQPQAEPLTVLTLWMMSPEMCGSGWKHSIALPLHLQYAFLSTALRRKEGEKEAGKEGREKGGKESANSLYKQPYICPGLHWLLYSSFFLPLPLHWNHFPWG